jgi:hypothetical protein
MGGSRNGQVEGWPNRSAWEKYVASWPAWRAESRCDGQCTLALVCGRARVCVRDARVPTCVTYALARLSAAAGERAPAPPGAGLKRTLTRREER